MTYRRSNRYQHRIRAMQAGRERARMEREPVIHWQPPDLRRRLIVEDYDTGEAVRTVIDMRATSRIDCYRVEVNGILQCGRMGWSRILGLLRAAIPRKCSARWRRQ